MNTQCLQMKNTIISFKHTSVLQTDLLCFSWPHTLRLPLLFWIILNYFKPNKKSVAEDLPYINII